MNQYHKLTLFLCGIWAATLIYGEMLAFWLPSLLTCSWPLSNYTPDAVDVSTHHVNVAVIADPQLMDRTSFGPQSNRFALEFAKFYSDLYIRRAYFGSVLPFKPDAIIFLGDYFDGGPYLTDEEWQESLSRFKHIFGIDNLKRHVDKIFLISGNHDVGYSDVNNRSPKVVQRYESIFGERNFRFSIGNVEFVAVDAQTLDGNHKGKMTLLSWEFIKNVSSADPRLHTRVLLTHIPLYRPDNRSCGIHRSSPIINQRLSRSTISQEIVYQNYISDASSRQLLDLLKPAVVLSGHDHDQCTVIHKSKFGTVTEHTLGTVSWQQGNLYPSFMLLSITSNGLPRGSTSEFVLTNLCFLPMQTHIYIWYIALFSLTILTLLLWPARGLRIGISFGELASSIRSYGSIGSEKKNEDEDCEYEMMWDAEGSVHLVRKPLAPSPPPHGRPEERGGAVLRAAAKRGAAGDVEKDFAVAGGRQRPPHPAKKSAMRALKRRVGRTLRMLAVIAAVNTPLYVMLLFKDWIDR